MLLYLVDAFADRPFTGNPAAVCLLSTDADDAWLQAVAEEMHLSETAFLTRRPDGDGFDLRWFTPTAEVDLCGHATLASAHVLWETGRLGAGETARFHSRSGLLTAGRDDDGWITMDFPAEPPAPSEPPPDLLELLPHSPRYLGRNRLDYLALLADEEAVRRFEPDLQRLGRITARGLIVTARADEGRPYDFVSRYFAPQIGIPEDPVTGSTHCCLAPFWAERLGRSALTGYQASARGGTVRVEARGEHVLLAGHAVTVVRGELAARAS